MSLPLTFRQDFGLVLVGSVLFTASFLWRDFFSEVRQKYFPDNDSLFTTFIYTVLVTFFLVVVAGGLRNVFGISATDAQQEANSGPDVKADDAPVE